VTIFAAAVATVFCSYFVGVVSASVVETALAFLPRRLASKFPLIFFSRSLLSIPNEILTSAITASISDDPNSLSVSPDAIFCGRSRLFLFLAAKVIFLFLPRKSYLVWPEPSVGLLLFCFGV
jgi:hypothetical protein